MAAAVSDIAAMGGSPLVVLLSQVVPPGDEERARDLAAAAGQRAVELGARVAGGNLTTGDRLAVHVTVLGALAPGRRPLTRSGARPGDSLWVSGALGGSALGLELLRAGRESTPEEKRRIETHLNPEPRIALGEQLAARGAARAAMDISDGLALDLRRLAETSGVGARIESARLPLAGTGDQGLQAALGGGEDYELLFASGDASAVRAAAEQAGVPVRRIGAITPPEEGVRLVGPDGVSPLPRRGWDALRRGPRTHRRTG